MKRILLVAPDLRPPLTEGRKLFVTDLAATLHAQGHEVRLLSGGDRSGLAAIRATLRELTSCLRDGAASAAALFPYGTFHGIRYVANTWFLRTASSLCSQAGVSHKPVFYSCAGLELDELAERFGPALAVGRSGPRVRAIRLGVRKPLPAWHALRSDPRRLLFLCGYQHPGRDALRNVLEQRGLIDILRAGESLADCGVEVSIAVPFFKDPEMRRALSAIARKLCPRLKIDLLQELDVVQEFSAHDCFLFPYRAAHAVFIPTSLLEAMSMGIPVIAADQAMYRGLTITNEGPRCGLHKAGDFEDLAAHVRAMKLDYPAAVQRASQAARDIRTEWRIECSAAELVSALDDHGK